MAPTLTLLLSLLDLRPDGVLFKKSFELFPRDALPTCNPDGAELAGVYQSADGPWVDLEHVRNLSGGEKLVHCLLTLFMGMGATI